MLEIPAFKTLEELQENLATNKSLYLTQKKATFKKADGAFGVITLSGVGAAKQSAQDENLLKRKLIINTTKIFDSHGDVHLDGLWNKSLRDNPPQFLLKEHRMSFDSVISRNIKASAETFTFKELGFPQFEGETQALVFNAEIDKQLPDMFQNYQKGLVNNHSVGMSYVKIDLAINNARKGYEEEFEVWEKHFDVIANKQDAEEAGYFWAVSEAKAIEGSAVLRGSNFVTPTLDNKSEPLKDTRNGEAANGTSVVDFYNSLKF